MTLSDMSFAASPPTRTAARLLADAWLPLSGSTESRIALCSAATLLAQEIAWAMRGPPGERTMADIRKRLLIRSDSADADAVGTALLNVCDARAELTAWRWASALSATVRSGGADFRPDPP